MDLEKVEVNIKREQLVIECEARSINDAGWMVFYFNKEYRSLVDKGWRFTCHEVGSSNVGGAERHSIEGTWCRGACEVATIVNAGPPEPPNHCDTCTCPPESECCK